MSIMPPDPDGKIDTPARKVISRRLRYEILRRDGSTCRYCHATDAPLTIDHVLPVALGGTDDASNLVAACKDCNGGKSSSSPDAAVVAQVSEDAIRWAEAMKLAVEHATAGDRAIRERTRAFHDYWWSCIPSYQQDRPRYRLPADWPLAFERLLSGGLPDAMIFDSIDVAVSQPTVENAFRYMLGVANNKLAKLQEAAHALLAEPVAKPTDTPCPECREWHPGSCGFREGYRMGYVDCSVMGTNIAEAGTGHPDHFAMLALSLVVDRPAHEWAKSWPYPSELYPSYSGRG